MGLPDGQGPQRRFLSTCACLLSIAAASVDAAERPGCGRPLEQWTVRHYDTEQGLPLDTVYALAGDRHGFVWVGTEDGLARFDGRRFDRIDLHPILDNAPEFTRSLTVGANGRLYAGISSSGVVAIETDTGRPSAMQLPLRSSIEALQVDGSRLLIGARGEKLLALDLAQGRPDSIGEREAPVRAIAPRSAGGYWIGHDGDGVAILQGDKLRPPPFDDLPNPYVSGLVEDGDGRLWIGTREGLFSWNGSELQHHAEASGLAGREHIVSLYLDEGGHLWVGTGGSGVARLCREKQRFERLGAGGELGRAHINEILEDRDGGVWLATGGEGLFQLLRGPAVPVGPEQGLPEFPVLPITQDRTGRMWFGTFGGGVARFDGDTVQVFNEDNSALLGDHVLSLAADEDGVWVGTRTGLNRVSGDSVSQPFEREFSTVSALLAEPAQLWIGSVNGLHLARDGQVGSIGSARGELSGHVLLLQRDSSGRLWVSSDSDGLHFLDERDGSLRPAPFSEALPSSSVYGLLEQPAGTLWFATSRGLARVRNGQVSVVDSRHGLIENLAFSILTDHHGHVWVSGNRGVFRMDLAQLDAVADGRLGQVDVMQFDRSSGMPRSETNGGFQYAAWRDQSGRMWYPTVAGAAVFDPAELLAPSAPLSARLTGVESDRGVIGLADRLDVAAATDWLRLHYSAPYFRRPGEVVFRYRLEGYDEDWFVTRERSALYRRLPPGRYSFVLQARTAGVEWSAPRRHVIEIDRFWYQYPLVWILSGALVLGLAVLALAWRVHQRRRQREQMAQAQKLEAVGLLAGGIAHDFNNVLAAIMSGTEILGDHLPADSPARRDAARIMDAAERGAGLTRQLLTFARRQKVQAQWLDLALELEAAREFIERLLPRGVALEWSVSPSPGFVHIDRVQLQQVLINLIVNARDAMDGEGRIAVDVRKAEAQAVAKSGLSTEGSYVVIDVSDDGPGLEHGIEGRIFEPFFTTKPTGRGTGLGLAVAYGIVDQAGGWIGVRSRPGQGATFTVLLPVRAGPPGQ